MVIIDIKQTSPERYTVCFDNGESIKSTLGAVADMRLYKGRVLDEEQAETFRTLSVRSLTLEHAVELISLRRMSVKELYNKLVRKGIDEDTARYCADKLADMGLLDDSAYACAVARHYSAKGYGAGRIRAEFYKRGIDRELWESAFAEIEVPGDKLQRLLAARIDDPNDRNQERKAAAFLARRGYNREQIDSALRTFKEEFEYGS